MKTLYILAIIPFFLLISSCEDLLEENPKTTISAENYYNNETNIRNATDAIYKVFNDGGANSIYGRNWPILDVGTDDVVGRTGQTNTIDWVQHTIVPDHKFFASWNQYQGWWKGVARANDVLKYITDIDFNDENSKNAIIGEARALRALSYLHLVKTWGDLPIITNSIETELDFDLPRSSVDEIYNQVIIPDLLFAEDNCVDDLHFGRVTKWTAKIILADVYLTRAGWRRTSAGEFVQGDPINWELARDKAKEIIDDSPHYLITDKITDGEHTTFACGVPWYESDPYSAEAMFEIGSINEANFGNWLSVGSNPNQSGIQFWGGNGVNTPLSDEGITKTINEMKFPGNPPGTGWYIPTPDLWDSYEEGDQRRDFNIMTRYTTSDGENYLCQPTFRKYVDINYYLGMPNTSNNNTTNNMIIYRYADALLIYAEAANEAENGPSLLAYNAINEIRRRAFDVTDDSYDLTGLSQEDFRKAVWLERRHEFAAECKRKFDLIRTNRLVSETTDIKTEFTTEMGSARDYTNVQPGYGTIPFPDHEWLYPIPQLEMERNLKNGWVQNEGY